MNVYKSVLYFQKGKYTVISAENITGIVGGSYYWYRRREILLVWSTVIITGISGGNYYGNVGSNYYW